jgi:hypothetical protein
MKERLFAYLRRIPIAAYISFPLVILGFVAIVTWQLTSISGLPDIGHPFDIEQFSKENIPDHQNAFTYYEQASHKYEDYLYGVIPAYWSNPPPEILQWIEANRESLTFWKKGTDQALALNVLPSELDFSVELEVLRPVRRLFQLACLLGAKCEYEENLEEAWEWYRAALRSSRHFGHRGSVAERLAGSSMHFRLATRLQTWSSHPRMTAQLLRRALQEFQAIDELRPPNSDFVKAEYVGLDRSLDRPEMLWSTFDEQNIYWGNRFTRSVHHFWSRLKSGFLREPERTRRVHRLLVANWLQFVDRPPSQRPLFFQSSLRYRDRATALRNDRSSELSDYEMKQWIDSTIFLKSFLPSIQEAVRELDQERLRSNDLVVELAHKLYAIEHGTPAKSDEDLVGVYLKALPEVSTKTSR